MIHELGLAIHHGLKLSDVADLVHVYPTLATSIGQLADEAAFEKAQKLRWLVRKRPLRASCSPWGALRSTTEPSSPRRRAEWCRS